MTKSLLSVGDNIYEIFIFNLSTVIILSTRSVKFKVKAREEIHFIVEKIISRKNLKS